MVEGNSVGFKILGLRGLSSGVQDSGTSVIRVEPETLKHSSAKKRPWLPGQTPPGFQFLGSRSLAKPGDEKATDELFLLN